MKLRYDPGIDTLTIAFRDGAVTHQAMAEGIVGQYDAQGQLVAFQVQDAVKRFGDQAVLRCLLREGLGPPVSEGKSASTRVAEHIVLDERGTAWVDDTNVKVIEVVLDKLAHGWGPDEIQAQYPGQLSLAQIHAAFTYYYDHQSCFDSEIERQTKEYDARKAAQGNDTPLHRKLRGAGPLP